MRWRRCQLLRHWCQLLRCCWRLHPLPLRSHLLRSRLLRSLLSCPLRPWLLRSRPQRSCPLYP
jgi:hypothetical protein